MSTDASQPLEGGPEPRWDLPKILDIRIRRIAFEPRRHRHFASSLGRVGEAIEFLVTTDGPVPARAMAPVLFVGDAPVFESESLGENRLRFLAFDVARLQPDAPITWGWGHARPEERLETRFRFRPEG